MDQNGPQNTNYSIYGHTFFGHKSAIYWTIGLKYFIGTQSISILYRLVMRTHDFDHFLKINPIFGRNMGLIATLAPKVWGLKTGPKVGPLSGPFVSIVNYISKNVFFIWGQNSPLKTTNHERN